MQHILTFVFSFLLVGVAATALYLKRPGRIAKLTLTEIEKSAVIDGTWEPSKLTERASSLFLAYQEAWCKDDVTWIETLCTPDFAERTILKMDVLRNLKRENMMINTRIVSIAPCSAHDDIDDTKDLFVMRIDASADDRLVSKETNEQLWRQDGPFTEYWTFNRAGNDWRIAGTRQASADITQTRNSAEIFALENDLFYEPEFGSLMFPAKGELFNKNKINANAIGDHVIGRHRGKIVEFYEIDSYSSGPSLLIAQAILPMGHFDILVRPKKFLQITPFGMKHHSTASTAFDKLFTVDSDPKDNVANFELLTPDFMQCMIDLPFEIAIEVVGNTLYFATREVEKADHKEMLRLLDKAFDAIRV